MENIENSPLIKMSPLTDQAVPFDKVQLDQFMPALQWSIQQAKENVAAIKTNSEVPTFENTVLALETCSESVDRVSGVYFNLFNAEASPEFQALAKDISPLLSEFSNDINLDEELFQKIKTVYENRSSLDSEQQKLVENYYKSFTRNGALLDSEKKETLRAIDREKSQLGPQFSENVLKATNAFSLVLESKDDLSGLPDSVIDAAALTAAEKNQDGKWVFTLQAPSFIPFLKYSDHPHLREKIWRAYASRAFNGDCDNQKTLLRIVQLRHQRAQLLGYSTHSHFVLEERMAASPEKVYSFLNELLDSSLPAAKRDVDELKLFAKELGNSEELMPWDTSYYSEKLRKKKFNLDEEELRPYFQLENVIQGVFTHAEKLYNIQFTPNTELPTYHPDVKAYTVTDRDSGDYVGLFYADFFPRETKKGGAWMTNYREQGLWQGDIRRPHVSIVCNFTKPTKTQPSLLSLDEVRTLFHEFGHALHSLLSQCKYPSMSGTNVYWDFVELPSQVMENWALESEGLALFAKHHETGKIIPDDLVKKIKDSAQFLAGFYSVRQLRYGFLDMSWHAQDPTAITDVPAFEKETLQKTELLPTVSGTNSSCSFAHIFAGGYSSGYYSYKWAEVLDADAFEFFKEKGLFNTEVAKKFKDHILSRGGTEHPMELYKKFRGREPDIKALLRRDGFI